MARSIIINGALGVSICWIFIFSASMGIPVQPLPDYQDGAEKVRVKIM